MAKTKNSRRTKNLGALFAASFFFAPHAAALPLIDGESSAAVSITAADSVMEIAGENKNNVLKWLDFSVGKGEKLIFLNQNNYLNYVTGNLKSVIAGSITGGGDVFIVNPHGIVIADGASINVGSLYLSSRVMNDDALQNFLTDGRLDAVFSANGDIVNKGTLNAAAITVEGRDIIFKNFADVAAADEKIKIAATGDIRIGFAAGEEIFALDADEYTNVDTAAQQEIVGEKFAFGDNEPKLYMLVRNPFELYNIRNNLGGSYMLANDIDFADWGEKFSPIGIKSNYAFTGNFDGLGFAIKNLDIDAENIGQVGLFAKVQGAAQIENFVLENGSVKLTLDENAPGSMTIATIGAVAGETNENGGTPTIRNVANENNITVVQTGGKKTIRVGGIAGQNGGTIETSFNAGNIDVVSSGSIYVGGIAGSFAKNAKISRAFNDGDIKAALKDAADTATLQAGGLVGTFNEINAASYIEESYNAGNVFAESDAANAVYAGGIVGFISANRQNKPATLTLDRAINFGKVAAQGENAETGGIVGKINAAKGGILKIENDSVYFALTNEAGENFYDDDGGESGTGKSREDLSPFTVRNNEIYNGWDIAAESGQTNTWRIYEGSAPPVLSAFLTPLAISATPQPYTGKLQTLKDESLTYSLADIDESKISRTDGEPHSGVEVGEYKNGTLKYYSAKRGYDIFDATKLVITAAENEKTETQPAAPERPPKNDAPAAAQQTSSSSSSSTPRATYSAASASAKPSTTTDTKTPKPEPQAVAIEQTAETETTISETAAAETQTIDANTTAQSSTTSDAQSAVATDAATDTNDAYDATDATNIAAVADEAANDAAAQTGIDAVEADATVQPNRDANFARTGESILPAIIGSAARENIIAAAPPQNNPPRYDNEND